MEIHQLKYFVHAAHTLNFTRAAEELYVSRQALSRGIKLLEQEINQALFQNIDNRPALTPSGEKFLRDVEPLVESFEDIERTYLKHYPLQHLSVACAHGCSLTLPEKMWDDFGETHPDIRCTIEEVSTQSALNLIKTDESDIGLVGSAPSYLQEFDYKLLTRTGLFVFVPKVDEAARKETLHLSDLDKKPFITFGKRNHLHTFFLEECAKAHVEPEVILETSDVELLTRSAKNQQAFYFGFPPHIESSRPPEHVLKQVKPETSEIFGTYLIKRKGRRLSHAAQQCWGFLLDTVR